MKIIKPYVTVEKLDPERIMKNLERYGRVCYKSEGLITEESAERFIAGVINRGHESVIEHEKLTCIFTVDRGISHEIVRHRIASYSMESTRYCNYSGDKFGNEITVIEPFFFLPSCNNLSKAYYRDWFNACTAAEIKYLDLLHGGASPQEARSILPNSLKTEIVVTMNFREWRHFFRLRAAKAAHPQMRQVAIPLLLYFREKLPVLFDDIGYDINFPEEHYAKVAEEADHD